jgi:hypothetical protein
VSGERGGQVVGASFQIVPGPADRLGVGNLAFGDQSVVSGGVGPLEHRRDGLEPAAAGVFAGVVDLNETPPTRPC